MAAARLAFAEPISAYRTLERATGDLASALCRELALRALGARRLDLVFHRVDGLALAVCVGTASPTRDPRHLNRLLGARLPQIDPGFGIEEAFLGGGRLQRPRAVPHRRGPAGLLTFNFLDKLDPSEWRAWTDFRDD